MKRYPNYKGSGVEFLGEVPIHWAVVPAKAACDVRPSNVDKKSVDGETKIRLCNYTDVYYNDVITDDMELMEATANDDQITRFTLRQGDVIITKDSETADDIGVGAFVPIDLPGVVCGYHLALVRPHAKLRGAFLKRIFDSSYAQSSFETRANGLTRVALGVSDISTLPIALPPVDEQAAIAAFLDRETAKIDALVAEQRRLIELLKEKRQAVISHAVTKGLNPDAKLKPSGIDWLGDVPEHWSIPPLYLRYHQVLGKMLDHGKLTGEHPVPYLRNIDVRWDSVNVDNLAVMDITPQERERFTVRKGDLLMVEGRELGRSAIWQGDDGVIGFQKALHRLRPLDETECVRFFYYMMVYVHCTGAFVANQSPNEIPHLTGEALRKYRFPKPPYVEQVAIVEHLDSMAQYFDGLAAEAERAIDLLQERRTALISAAVTGKIDVRGLSEDEAA